jgi:hypothetical protein
MEDIDKLRDRILNFKRGMENLNMSPVKDEGYVSPLNEANMKIKGSADIIDTKTPIAKIKNATDHIDTKSIQKQVLGDAFEQRIKAIRASRALSKAGGIAGDMIKKVPMIGGIAAGLGTLLSTGDASAASQAALPLVSEADDLGPSMDSLEGKMEAGTATPDELYRLRNGMK